MAETRVRPFLIVFDSPSLDFAARVVERDEDVFVKASSRSRLLKLSMKAFWIGLPGSMNCSFTPRS